MHKRTQFIFSISMRIILICKQGYDEFDTKLRSLNEDMNINIRNNNVI